MSKHTLADVLKIGGVELTGKYTVSAIVIVTDEKGLSITPLDIPLTSEVSPIELGDTPTASGLSRVLAIEGAAMLSALVQVAEVGEKPMAVVLTEGADGTLRNEAMDTVMAQIKGSMH